MMRYVGVHIASNISFLMSVVMSSFANMLLPQNLAFKTCSLMTWSITPFTFALMILLATNENVPKNVRGFM